MERIKEIRVMPINMTLKEAVNMSIGQVNISQHIIVKIITSSGVVGLGEAALETGPIFSYESQQSALLVIQNYLADVIIGMDVSNIEDINMKMDQAVKGNPFAKSAVEMAIIDAWAQVLGVPLYKILGGKVRGSIVHRYGLHSMDVMQEVSEAIQRAEEGYKLFKIKVGALDIHKDIERVRAIREALGYSVRIGIDANAGWNVKDTIKVLDKLEKYELDFIEQPVASHDLKGMAEIRKRTRIPIMADESVFSPEDMLRVSELGAADIISIKIAKAGGIFKAKKIAAIAEAAGLLCYCGGMAESGIGASAGLHLIASTPNMGFGCELEPPYDSDLVSPKMIIENGLIKVPEGIGLGVTPIQEEVKKM